MRRKRDEVLGIWMAFCYNSAELEEAIRRVEVDYRRRRYVGPRFLLMSHGIN